MCMPENEIGGASKSDGLAKAKQKIREVWSRYATVDEENAAWAALKKARREQIRELFCGE